MSATTYVCLMLNCSTALKQVLTKTCLFDGLEMATLNKAIMSKAVATSVKRLGTNPDLIQFYWGDYSFPKYVDAAK